VGLRVVLEGRILAGKREPEGPFGEFPGYYSGGHDYPVIEVDRVSHRKDPIYESLYLGKPWTELDYVQALTTCAPIYAQWMMDIMAKKLKPTNRAPGLIYMLCGATQHSNTDPFDGTSPGIPIGPHWMIIWPYDAKLCGLPNTVRDAGAWVMFDGTPYAYLHICGTPWTGNEYGPGQVPIWTMRYSQRSEP